MECLCFSLQVCVGEGQVSHLQCPNQRCTSTLSDPLLQSILPKELFERSRDYWRLLEFTGVT